MTGPRSTQDPPLNRALDIVSGYKTLQIVGYSEVIDDSGWKLIGAIDGAVPALPTAAGELSIVSSDAGDTGGVVQVVYLDENKQERVATYVANGTTPVTQEVAAGASVNGWRVQQVRCRFANTGVVTARIEISASPVAQMAVAVGAKLSRTAIYTVPVGQVAWIWSLKAWASATKPVEFRVRAFVPDEADAIELFHFPLTETISMETYRIPRVLEDTTASGSWVREFITIVIEAQSDQAQATNAQAIMEMEAEQTTDAGAAGFRVPRTI
jgi:hypothetical protein